MPCTSFFIFPTVFVVVRYEDDYCPLYMLGGGNNTPPDDDSPLYMLLTCCVFYTQDNNLSVDI